MQSKCARAGLPGGKWSFSRLPDGVLFVCAHSACRYSPDQHGRALIGIDATRRDARRTRPEMHCSNPGNSKSAIMRFARVLHKASRGKVPPI